MLASLAALYAAGRDVHCPALFPKGGRCVSLPGYPWQRERYWIDQLPGGSDSSPGSSEGHPLLGEATESALPGGQRFWEQEIDLAALHYLSGHKVLGSTVFPGAGYIEAALAAIRELRPESRGVEISGLRFHEPMPLSAKASRRLQLAVSPNASGGHDFQFSSRKNASAGWTRHASGTATGTDGPADPIALDEIRNRCTDLIAGHAHYDAMAGQGLDYGDNYRAITRLWRTRGEALAELELDAGAAAEAQDYCVHPILIDAALQLASATIEPTEGSTYSKESYVPQGVGRAAFTPAREFVRPASPN